MPFNKEQLTTKLHWFFDGTVIEIDRPSGQNNHWVTYDAHKKKNASNFQAVNYLDGMILHAYGPMEGQRHDWKLYVRRGLDEELLALLNV